jgi:hypothetical protein
MSVRQRGEAEARGINVEVAVRVVLKVMVGRVAVHQSLTLGQYRGCHDVWSWLGTIAICATPFLQQILIAADNEKESID